MTLGWDLLVGPAAESYSQIWLPRLIDIQGEQKFLMFASSLLQGTIMSSLPIDMIQFYIMD